MLHLWNQRIPLLIKETIGKMAFDYCTSLRMVIIPNACTLVKNYAFQNCSAECVINCEALEKPTGWETSWNYSSCQVVWGYTR